MKLTRTPRPTKKPWLAATLNIVPGLGYLYLGKRIFFSMLLVIGLVIGLIAVFYNPAMVEHFYGDLNAWDLLAFAGLAVFISAFVWDAYNVAFYNKD